MKDSHIDWIGAIPEDWSTIPFRRVFEITKRLAGKTGLDVLSVTQQGIKIKDLSSNEGQMAQDYSNYQLVFPTDFVMNHMDLLTGYVDISSYTGVTSPDYRVFRARKPQEISLEYFLHIFQLCYKCKIFYHLGQGVSGLGRWRLPAKQMLLFELPLPPLNEQQAIADFLDKKCGEIDEMISLQEKIVEELKAYKQSVITEAVCKGLNPDVPMKDSGIEWIGQIPEGWLLPNLVWLTSKIGSGYTPRGGSETYVRQGIKFLRSQNVYFEGFNLEDVAYISPEIDEEMSGTRVQEGDILFNITGGSIGRCRYVDSSLGAANVNQHVCIVRPNGISTKFLFYFLQSASGQVQVDLYQTGGNREGLSASAFKTFVIPLPPDKTQNDIADYLDTKCAEIDTLISVRQAKIDVLKEYKKSIIYEYITGKKEIPYGD